jgi:hypothetical protein
MTFFWYLPLILLLPLLSVLAHRRVYKSFPYFFAYVAFAVAAGAARFAVRDHAHIYFVTYWATAAGYDVLGILVMYEVFRAMLGGLIKAWWARLIFLVVLAGSIGLSLARNQATAARLGGRLMLYIVIGEMAVRFVQVAIFAGLASLVPLFGLRWRQHAFGIATGFGVYATVALLTTTKFSDFGTRFKFLWFATSVASYSIAVLIWLWFFSAPEKAERPSGIESGSTPGELEHYKEALRRLH